MAKTRYEDDVLEFYQIKDFRLGYNSYTASKSLIKDQEFPYGQNVYLDDNGAVTKRGGKVRYGGEVESGKAVMNMAQYRTPTVNELIVAAGTTWKKKDGDSWSDLSGMTFTDSLKTRFVQTAGSVVSGEIVPRLYGCNGTDNLAYYNGSTITKVSSNGNVGSLIEYWGGRLYMNNATHPDRIYFSNPYTYNASNASFDISNFGTFNTDLTSTPKKTAGYFLLFPGSGIRITGSKVKGDNLYVWDDRHIWKIGQIAEANSDGSIAHSISTIISNKGATSADSIIQIGNDIWFFDYDNYFRLGEQAQYSNNERISPTTGRIRSEINSIAPSGKDNVVAGYFDNKLWVGYQTGAYNDRVITWDSRMNAWSSPLTNINANCFLEFIEDDGSRSFLAGSSNSADSYVYKLETTSNDQGTAIDAYFETKSTDCGKPGLIKRFAFIDVFYSMVYGELSYEVFVDEVSSVTGSLALGNSTSRPVGMGSMMMGSFPMGLEYDTSTTFASMASNDNFRINCGFTAGKKISVRFSNNNTGEQFKINGIAIHYIDGSVYEV